MVVVYVTNLKNSRMIIPDVMEYLMFKNNGRFYRSYWDFLVDKTKWTGRTRVYFIYNLSDKEKIEENVKTYVNRNLNCRLLTEYQFAYCILTGNECWLSLITNEMEASIRKIKREVKIFSKPKLGNLLGEIIDIEDKKMLIKSRSKEQKNLDKEEFKNNPECNNYL